MHPPKAKARARDEVDTAPNGVERDVLGVQISEHDVETEFWRLVDSKNETVEVEYGADIHSGVSSSRIPLMARDVPNADSSSPTSLPFGRPLLCRYDPRQCGANDRDASP